MPAETALDPSGSAAAWIIFAVQMSGEQRVAIARAIAKQPDVLM